LFNTRHLGQDKTRYLSSVRLSQVRMPMAKARRRLSTLVRRIVH
jgi:hypothetical protein